MDRLKYTRPLAERAYEEAVPGYDERGRLPARSMQTFWSISIANGDVKAALPEAGFLDDRFIRTYGSWAPA